MRLIYFVIMGNWEKSDDRKNNKAILKQHKAATKCGKNTQVSTLSESIVLHNEWNQTTLRKKY